jgi:predicted metal-binding membrane protein
MSMYRGSVPPAVERAILFSSILILALAAWAALWFADDFANGALHVHHLGHYAGGSGSMVLLFVGGWTVMVVAMMLPTTLPIISTFHTIAGTRGDRFSLVGLVVAGYIITWASFGVIIYLTYLLLHWLVNSTPVLKDNSWAAVPSLLILAGFFQFTSLKYRCLDKCRSPFSFVIEHWQGRKYKWLALRLGIDHGIFCVGCCWALMLLMFIVGFGSVGWMFVLALIMAIEKNVSWGRRISTPLGIILISLGVILLVNFLSK